MMDLTGTTFGRLTVIKEGARIKNTGRGWSRTWQCKCECGKITTTRERCLTLGHSKSCGCLHREVSAKMKFKHGGSFSPEYQAWADMKGRCYNPKSAPYPDYGGRGISVSPEWKSSYAAFISDMGKRPSKKHTLERKDNDGNYCKENCMWTTMHHQNRNKRNNRFVTLAGIRMTIRDASIATGMEFETIRGRIARGWSEHDALHKPLSA